MFEQAQKDNCENEDGTCDNEGHIHIGDYVNYTPVNSSIPSTDLTYTSYGDKSGMGYFDEESYGGGPNYYDYLPDEIINQKFVATNSTTWRILGLEEAEGDKHILLTSGSPIKKETSMNDPNYYLYSVRAYMNMEEELDNICSIYGHGDGAIKARSLTIEDVNKICGVTVDSSGIKPEGINKLNGFGSSRSFTNQYASPEDFLAKKRTNFSEESNSYEYNGDNQLLNIANNKRLYEMIFYPEEQQYYKANWIASKCIDSITYSAGCGFDMGIVCAGRTGPGACSAFNSNGTEYYFSCGVRPVVYLETDSTKNIIEKIPDQQEEDWTEYDGCSMGGPT